MAERPPDVELLLRELGHLIRQLTRLVGGADDGPPMTATQRIALVELGDDGPLRLNDLARRMGTSTPTASRSVDTLEALGLVTRVPDPSDRRALSIDVSARGRDLLDDRLRRAAHAFEPAAATLSSADRRELVALLRRMTDALRATPPS
ncbi:MAG: MarR family winged helix-turn-helix transcriptional regulator [Gaiellaceae bacterium]